MAESSQFVHNKLKPKVKKINSILSGLSSKEGSYKKHVPSFYIKETTPSPELEDSVATSSVSSQCDEIRAPCED